MTMQQAFNTILVSAPIIYIIVKRIINDIKAVNEEAYEDEEDEGSAD